MFLTGLDLLCIQILNVRRFRTLIYHELFSQLLEMLKISKQKQHHINSAEPWKILGVVASGKNFGSDIGSEVRVL